MSNVPAPASRLDRAVADRRRHALLDQMKALGPGGSLLLLPSWPVMLKNGDQEHEYRQDSDFFYLTGFAEQESVLFLSTETGKLTLFVRPRDPEREIWDGPRAGVDGAKRDFGADESFPLSELDKELPRLLGGHTRLLYRLNRDRAFDEKVLTVLDRLRSRGRTPTVYPSTFVDPGTILHEMRIKKDADEIARMRRAAAISGDAHRQAMGAAKPGMYEFEVEAVIAAAFRRGGAERQAYGPIVGTGPNATILHYRANDRRLEDGDLLLIDAGCEFGHYASDITRTFPVSGTFSKPQRQLYEIVLEAQLASIAATKPGATLEQIHDVSVDVITRGLVKLGLLSGDVGKLIETHGYKPFYMHRTSHWIGMDVHDVGAYYAAGMPRPLAAGMALTIEPGIYVAKDAPVPAEYRGIGIRIEDDILVTESGCENLTLATPKTVAEVEAACRG